MTSWKCTKVLITKSFQDFIDIKQKVNFIMFDMELFKKFKF